MQTRFSLAVEQLQNLRLELVYIVNKRQWRWITMWFGGTAGVIASYRLERFGYLLFGDIWVGLRVLAFPFFALLAILSTDHDISYRANVGKGLKVLHPKLGVNISKKAIIGENLTLVGGNCIGRRTYLDDEYVVIGNNVTLGVNSVVLGPLTLGNDVVVGAGAVVLTDAPDGAVLVGVPARPKNKA